MPSCAALGRFCSAEPSCLLLIVKLSHNVLGASAAVSSTLPADQLEVVTEQPLIGHLLPARNSQGGCCGIAQLHGHSALLPHQQKLGASRGLSLRNADLFVAISQAKARQELDLGTCCRRR